MTETANQNDRATAPGQVSEEPVTRPEEEPSIGELVARASKEVSTLIRAEIALVKSEVTFSAKAGGLAAGLFAAAAFMLVLGIIMLSVAIAYFLTMTGMHPAWAFLIVFVLYLLVTAVLALVGVRKVKQVKPPERAIAQAQETKETLFNRGGSEPSTP
jgi:uncharacterized membrane protein